MRTSRPGVPRRRLAASSREWAVRQYHSSVRVEICLLGDFTVRVDGEILPVEAWHRRSAAALVKVLALTPRRRMHRERLIDGLWPDLPLDVALPRLHKAAHYARQAFGSTDAVSLDRGTVALLPGDAVEVDVIAFEAAADAALKQRAPSTSDCAAAIERYRGELLPDDLDQPWSDEPRRRLRARFEHLLRSAHRWPELLELNPADEQAHVELLRRAVDAGDRHAALRRYDELARALANDLGVAPGPEAVALRERALAQPGTGPVAFGAVRADRNGSAVGDAHTTLLERDGDLAGLQRILRSVAATGRGAVVSVTGEAGSGKSSLVRAFLEAVSPDVAVAAGGCDDLLAPRSLGPFRDMADALPGVGTALTEQRPPEEVFPRLLRALAARPTVVLVEDVHWADDVTLDAIRYLARRIPGTPSLLLLTYRDEDVDLAHPLRRVLAGLSGSSSRRIELAPLSVAAVRRMSGADATEAAEIHRVTRGNPFFVTEVLATGGATVPTTVRDAVLARVGRLPAPGRRLAERLAVVPSRAERWLAEALAGGEPEPVLQAERAGVLSGGTRFVSFRHELARRALESSLTVGERVRAHREVLDVLLRREQVEPWRIVHHAVRADRGDLIDRYGPIAAADAERVGAQRQAAETLRVVLDHAERLDEPTRANLLTRRAYALYLVNEYETALTVADTAVSVAEDVGDPALVADALVVLSRIVLFARGPLAARRAAQRAVDMLGQGGDDGRLAEALTELARTHSNLPTIGVVAQPSLVAVRSAEHAIEKCDRLDRNDLRAQSWCYLGSARLANGDPRGLADIERAIEIGAGETRLETRVRGYVNAAGSCYRTGRFREALRYVAAGLRVAADGEFLAGQYRLGLTAAGVAASSGEWDRAVAELRRLIASPGDAGIMAPLARSMLARLLARRGEPEAAAVLHELLHRPAAERDSYVAGPVAVAQIEVGWLTGTLREVPVGVSDALESAAAAGHTAMLGELVVYLRRAGFPTQAPTEVPEPWAAGLAGRWREAAAGWEALGDRYERAVELGLADEPAARDQGVHLLTELGAGAAVSRLTVGTSATF